MEPPAEPLVRVRTGVPEVPLAGAPAAAVRLVRVRTGAAVVALEGATVVRAPLVRVRGAEAPTGVVDAGGGGDAGGGDVGAAGGGAGRGADPRDCGRATACEAPAAPRAAAGGPFVADDVDGAVDHLGANLDGLLLDARGGPGDGRAGAQRVGCERARDEGGGEGGDPGVGDAAHGGLLGRVAHALWLAPVKRRPRSG